MHGDALAWMDAHPAGAHAAVVTSLPDVSELPHLGLAGWRAWFVGAVGRVLRWLPPRGVAVFYQSDVRVAGAWVDKGHLVLTAADEARATVLFHSIVCRKPPGTIAFGRPSYSHMIGLARAPLAVRRPIPDVLPSAGAMPWSKAMGVEACRAACRFLRDEAGARVVVDPFCGRGTVLAVANELGLDAVGVDVAAKRCRAARSLVM